MTGGFRIEALVSSSRPRSPLRLTRLPMTRLLLAAALVAAFFLSPSPTAADTRFTRLSEPGIVAILRHAVAPGTGDPANFALDDCATQRNLGAQGREQARKIGAAIRAAGATVDRVLTSQWCRCRDTARYLDLGPVEDLPALNSFFRNRDRAGPQTAELRQFLLGLQPGKNRCPGYPSGEHHGAHGQDPRLGRGLPAEDRARRHDLCGRRDPDRPLATRSARPDSRLCSPGRNGHGQRNEACPEPGPPKYTIHELRHSFASEAKMN